MSEQQGNSKSSPFGSNLAGMFGYVTDEDRSKWERDREANRKNVGAARSAVKAGFSSVAEFVEKNVDGQVRATRRLSSEHEFEQEHERVRSASGEGRTTIGETVDYRPRDRRNDITDDYEF